MRSSLVFKLSMHALALALVAALIAFGRFWAAPAPSRAKACEAAAFRLDRRVVNSEGATVSCQPSSVVAIRTRRG